MFRTFGRFGWLLAVALAGCVLSAGMARAADGDAAALGTALRKGIALQKAGQAKEALPYYEQSLELSQRLFGQSHENTAAVLGVLASLYVASTLNNLASLYSDMGQYAKAEPLFQRSLKISEEKLGKDDPDVASTLNNLAILYEAMGQYAKAEAVFQRSLKIRENKLGKDHPDVARSLNNLAVLYDAMGQYAKAEPLYQRSLKIKEDKLGKDHPDVAQSLNNLANLYADMGQYARAEPLYQRSLQIREDKLGKDHPDVAQSLNNLASQYADMGQYAKAEPLFQRSLKIWEDKLGNDHPDVAKCLNNLANLYAIQRNWKQAAQAADQERRVVRRYVANALAVLSEKDQLAYLDHRDAKQFHIAESIALNRREDAAPAALSAGWVLNGKAVAQESLAQRVLAALDARDLAAHLGKTSAQSSRAEPWVELAEIRKALPADAVLIEISKFQVANFEAKGQDKHRTSIGWATATPPGSLPPRATCISWTWGRPTSLRTPSRRCARL